MTLQPGWSPATWTSWLRRTQPPCPHWEPPTASGSSHPLSDCTSTDLWERGRERGGERTVGEWKTCYPAGCRWESQLSILYFPHTSVATNTQLVLVDIFIFPVSWSTHLKRVHCCDVSPSTQSLLKTLSSFQMESVADAFVLCHSVNNRDTNKTSIILPANTQHNKTNQVMWIGFPEAAVAIQTFTKCSRACSHSRSHAVTYEVITVTRCFHTTVNQPSSATTTCYSELWYQHVN